MKRLCLILIFLLICFSLFSVGQKDNREQAENKEKITVFTSIMPQKYFVERIGGDRVTVNVFVGPGKSPATYEPTPGQIVALSRSDIFFSIGVLFEQAFLPTIRGTLKNLKIIDTSEGIEKRMFNSEDKQEKIQDPHIWMSPGLVKIQAETIFKALVKNDPDGKETYTKGYNRFIDDLNLVHDDLNEVLGPLRGNILLVFHPAFGYFADDFGLKQVAIETGGKEPGPAMLEKIIMKAREKNVKVIFVQPEFSLKSAQVIARAIDGAVIMLNPLDPDYINNLRHIAFEVKKAFN